MTFGENAQYRTVFHKKERELIQSHLTSYITQLKEVPEIDENFRKNYKWVELKSKIELCERLLGKRL